MKPILVKICGITNSEDALWAVNLGADFIGVNFYAESPRKVSLEKASEIVSSLPPFVKAVGIFVNPELSAIEKILKKVTLHFLQLHGKEIKDEILKIKSQFNLPVWKAVRMENESSLSVIPELLGTADAILLDAFHPDQMGGTGKTFDWTLANKAKEYGIPIILSGGLNPENVIEAVNRVNPFAVDTASGVEKDGHPRKKDIEKVKLFITRAKGS